MAQAVIEHGDVFGRRPFLRRESMGGAVWAKERIGDVAGHGDVAVGKTVSRLDAPHKFQHHAIGCSSFPVTSRKRQPSALSMPMPPSLVALPPMPTISRRAPALAAARSISPTP